MIDLRSRSIKVKLDNQWYCVTFKPKFLGRVKNVKVWKVEKEDSSNLAFLTPYKTEVEIIDYSTVQVMKEVLHSLVFDIKLPLYRLCQKMKKQF